MSVEVMVRLCAPTLAGLKTGSLFTHPYTTQRTLRLEIAEMNRRLRGKGLPSVPGYGNGTGDLVVNISVYVPKTLSSDEKKAIEKFRESDNFNGDKATKKSIFERFKNYFN